MARIVLNRPLDSHRVPNMAPEATEMGDTWDTVLKNINSMTAEQYAGTAPTTVVAGTTSATLTGGGVINLTTVGDYVLGAPASAGIYCDIIFNSTQGSTASGTSIVLTSSAFYEGVNTIAHNTKSCGGTSAKMCLSLVSQSTSSWAIVNNFGTLLLTTA